MDHYTIFQNKFHMDKLVLNKTKLILDTLELNEIFYIKNIVNFNFS